MPQRANPGKQHIKQKSADHRRHSHQRPVQHHQGVSAGEIAPATEETKVIRLSTTTSVNDSGLLGYLLPVFEPTYGYTVEVQSAGTGKAINAAKFGNADLILVHSKSQEGRISIVSHLSFS